MGSVLRAQNVRPDGMAPDSSHLVVLNSHGGEAPLR